MRVLTLVTGRVDCFGCVCALQTLRLLRVLCVLCVLMFMYCSVFYFTGIFDAVVRQISMLFIDHKDSVFCIHVRHTGREMCETHVERCMRHRVVYSCIALSDTQVKRCMKHTV